MTENIFQFLSQLALNNNRSWFETNKAWYQKARKEFEEGLAPCLAEISQFEDLGNLTPLKAIFRIYRDVRFSKNKDPYKINFSAMIAKDGKKEMSAFGYYLHIQPSESFMAAGIYEPTSDQLYKIRQEIDYNADELKEIIYQKDFVEAFGQMQGHKLKSKPKGYPKDHPEIELLNYTQFYFCRYFDDKEVLAPNFPKLLAESCFQIRPFLEFLNNAVA